MERKKLNSKILTKNNLLNRQKEIIQTALGDRDLSKKQLKAIEQIVTGYSQLIVSSLSLSPDSEDVNVIMENIRSGILSTLLIMETYVQPKQSLRSNTTITG